MLELSFAILGVFIIFAMSNWQYGIFAAVLMALIQDPLRKLTPGEPVVFILFTGVVFGAAMVGATAARIQLNPAAIVGWRFFMRGPFTAYIFIVLVQAVHSLVRFGNPVVSALGLVNYLAPFGALVLAYSFAVYGGSRRIRDFLRFYLVFAVIALATVYLEFVGFAWPVLGEVGSGLKIYDLGKILHAHSGTFRASEIAAWHAATCVCLIIILLTSGRKPTLFGFLVTLILAATLVGIGILTGRRKLLVVIAVFVCAYVALLAVFIRGARAPAIAVVLVGVLIFLVSAFGLDAGPEEIISRGSQYDFYVARTSSAFSDVPKRFIELGIAPVTWAYNWFGFLGGGLGIGTQGVQHLTNVGRHIGAAEGGLGKLTLELGFAGLLIVGMLWLTMSRYVWRILKFLSIHSAMHTRLASGLVALLIANAANFAVATQTYGDIFVLTFLGIVLGAVLAMPVVAQNEIYRPPGLFNAQYLGL